MSSDFDQPTEPTNRDQPATPFGELDLLNEIFREILDRPSVEKEFFLPATMASWELDNVRKDAEQKEFDVKYTLGKTNRKQAIPTIVGVRLQERDPNEGKGFREKSVQTDLHRLVKSVNAIRKQERLKGVVLSEEWVKGKDPGLPWCKRVRFGLTLPADGRFKGDVEAAKECHNQIMRAVKKAGFKLEPPSPPFNTSTGMKGLEEWAENVRLLRRRQFRPCWLLFLLLFLPLPCMCNYTDRLFGREQDRLFGMELKEDSFLILVDRSRSMTESMDKVRAEVKRLLDHKLKNAADKPTYCNIILYDDEPKSVLGGIQPLNADTAKTLVNAVMEMKPGNGTKLKKAMDRSVDEIKDHKKPTTILILSDGKDKTIPSILSNRDALKERAGGPFTVHATTPRLFDGTGDPRPLGEHEPLFAAVPLCMGGHFGPTPKSGSGGSGTSGVPSPQGAKTPNPVANSPNSKSTLRSEDDD